MAKTIGKHQQLINKFNDLNTGITPSKINKSYTSGIPIIKIYVTKEEFTTLNKLHPNVINGYYRGGFTLTYTLSMRDL